MTDSRFAREDPNPVPLDTIQHPDFDVREYRQDDDIDAIAASMDREGQYMPIYLGQRSDGVYPILDGNHRYLAAKRLNWDSLDAIKLGVGRDEDMAQVVTNLTRIELSNEDKLHTFHYLFETLDLGVTEAADKVGLDKASASRYKTILDGYPEIKQYFMAEELGQIACYQLNLVPDRDRAVEIAETAQREGYIDRDVIHQAKYARKDEEGKNAMELQAGGQTKQNLDQVRRNAEALNDLDPVDQEAIQDASVGAQGDADTTEGDGPDEPQGPPCPDCDGHLEDSGIEYECPDCGRTVDMCDLCGLPSSEGHLVTVDIDEEAVGEDAADRIQLGPQCGSGVLQFLNQLQAQAAQRGR